MFSDTLRGMGRAGWAGLIPCSPSEKRWIALIGNNLQRPAILPKRVKVADYFIDEIQPIFGSVETCHAVRWRSSLKLRRKFYGKVFDVPYNLPRTYIRQLCFYGSCFLESSH